MVALKRVATVSGPVNVVKRCKAMLVPLEETTVEEALCYLERYDDVQRVCADKQNEAECARTHWLSFGQKEGRDKKCWVREQARLRLTRSLASATMN